jgi:hypothetical protein
VYWRKLRFAKKVSLRDPPNPFTDPVIRWTRLLGIIFVMLSGLAFFAGCFASIGALSTFKPA